MTDYLRVDALSPDAGVLERAATVLRGGGLVAFPTETVYGLAAISTSPAAAERLLAVKGRSENVPFSRLIADREDLLRLVSEVPPQARALIDRYWPGPLTIVLPVARGSDSTVGVRLPASDVARTLVRLAGAPLLAPSANPHGRPPALTADEVKTYFDGAIDVVIDAGPVLLMQASTVVRFGPKGYEVLRSGIITPEMVHQQLGGKSIVFVCTGNTCRSPMAAALFRKHLARKLGRAMEDLEELGFRIYSAGTSAIQGAPASSEAVRLMQERGCDISRHTARPLTPERIATADRIYAMSSSHLEALNFVLALGPAPPDAAGTERAPAQSRGLRLALLASEEIQDPIGADYHTYRDCADQIEAAVHRLVDFPE